MGLTIQDVRNFAERAWPGLLRAYLTKHRRSHVHAYLRAHAGIQTANPYTARWRRHLKFGPVLCAYDADHPDGSCAHLHAHAVRIRQGRCPSDSGLHSDWNLADADRVRGRIRDW